MESGDVTRWREHGERLATLEARFDGLEGKVDGLGERHEKSIAGLRVDISNGFQAGEQRLVRVFRWMLVAVAVGAALAGGPNFVKALLP